MFKSRLSNEQKMAIQINTEFDKRKERMSHANTHYRSKIKSIQDFEVEQYDGGDKLEVLVKKLSTISYNVLQMCQELFNGTPGQDLKERIKGVLAKLLLEYGDHTKELTEQIEEMMDDIAKLHINSKLNPNFLTAMTNIIILLHKLQDDETDEFLEEVKETKVRSPPKRSRRGTLGPRKLYLETISAAPKVTVKKSLLDYNSSDSDDTMISKIPTVLDLDDNTIAKLKQRIYVWAEEHPDFEPKDVPIKLVLKNLDQIYSGSYRSLSVVSIAEARTVRLPSWLTRRLKQKNTDTSVIKSEQYKTIPRKLKATLQNTNRHSISQYDKQDNNPSDTPEQRSTTRDAESEQNQVPVNTIQSPIHTEQDNIIQIEDIQENDNQHKTDEEEESQTTEMDTCNDLIRIGENYLTQTNYKLEEVQSTQESAQETSSTQEEPAITAVTEKESEYEKSQETNDTPGKDISTQIDDYNERINQRSPEYEGTPIQERRQASLIFQEYDDLVGKVTHPDLTEVQSRLFYQTASGTGNNQQRNKNSEDDRKESGDRNNRNNQNDYNNSRNNQDRNTGRQGPGQNNNNRDGSNNNNNDRNNNNNKNNKDKEVSQDEIEDLEKLLDDQNSDSSDYDDEIIYQTLHKVKPYKLTETSRYLERYAATEFPIKPREPIGDGPQYMQEELEKFRPSIEWETVYDPVAEVQVNKLEWALNFLVVFSPDSDATKNMDNFPTNDNMARTMDAQLILIEGRDLVPIELAERVQSNRRLVPKTPSPTSSHPIIGNLIQNQKTHYMAHYYLTNMAINIPKILNPALDSIKT